MSAASTPGYRAREIRAQLKAASKPSEEIRAIRAAMLRDRELKQQKEAADERVALAREQLERLNPTPLQAELEAALQEQAELAELSGNRTASNKSGKK